MLTFLAVVFVLSGAAGLIYESIWTRYLGLFVGHSAYAQVLVLVIFLGGMSAGAFLLGRKAEQVARPLRWYAFVELAVGLIGLMFHEIFVWSTQLAYSSVFPALGPGVSHSIAKWLIAALLILPQSVLLGATFPLMTAGAIRLRRENPGRAIALLYFANSLGASIGVLLAGFVLIELAGLPGTLAVAAMLNLVVAAAAFIVGKGEARGDAAGPLTSNSLTSDEATDARLTKLLLLVSFGTAVSSFVYEIGWIRMLSLVLGSATHSFELMLSAFILGLAIGALVIRRRTGHLSSPLRTLGYVQLAMGALAVGTLPLYVDSFSWMADFMSAFARSPAGYRAFNLSRYAICLIVMIPATVCAGMTLPLITHMLLRGPTGERAIGTVYAVNTLGSIIGVVLAALVLLPAIGLKWLLVGGAAIDVALGVAILFPMKEERRLDTGKMFPALASALLLFAVGATTRFDKGVLTSGVFRYGSVFNIKPADMLFYKDGKTATVSVRRITASGGLSLATNGKPDASLGRDWFDAPTIRRPFTHDASTQVLLPLILLAHAPQATQAAVIGQGSGMSSHIMLQNPRLKKLVTIEIESEMIRASRQFYPANRSVFDDPRSSFALDDARSYFAAQGTPLDLILSEPSTPWVAGVSGLFTSEFYRHARSFLSPDGVFGQWLHLTEIDDGLVLTVVRAVAENFPAYAMYAVGNRDILIVAGNRSVLREPDWSVVDLPPMAAALRRIYPLSPVLLNGLHMVDSRTLAPLVTGGGGNSDFYPTLDLGAERARYLSHEAVGFVGLAGDRFAIAPILEGTRAGIAAEWRNPIASVPRLEAMQLSSRMYERLWADAPQYMTAAAERAHAVDLLLASTVAPLDWQVWAAAVRDAEESRGGGTAGVADSVFYAMADQFMDRHDAPPAARATIAFLHGMAAWDFNEASGAAELLIRRAKFGEWWVPVDMLREGTAVARIRLGDAVGAKSALTSLGAFATRDPNDVRPQLLFAWIAQMEREKKSPLASLDARR